MEWKCCINIFNGYLENEVFGHVENTAGHLFACVGA